MSETAGDFSDEARPDVARLLQRQVALEERLGKLETTLAGPFTSPTEEALTERVIAKLATAPPLVGPERVLVLNSADDGPPPPPSGAVPQPPVAAVDPARRTWFLTQLLAEFRLALRMYFDPHYRISRTTQFVLPGILLLMVTNYFLFAMLSVPVLNPILERLFDLALAIVGYKLLLRELGALPRSPGLPGAVRTTRLNAELGTWNAERKTFSVNTGSTGGSGDVLFRSAFRVPRSAFRIYSPIRLAGTGNSALSGSRRPSHFEKIAAVACGVTGSFRTPPGMPGP